MIGRGRDQEERPSRDRLVILTHEGSTAQILRVADVDHQRVLAQSRDGEQVIPITDLRQFISDEGRVFVLNAPEWYIQETKHLALVENALVIAQAVQYQRPGAALPRQGGLMKILPWALAAFALIAMLLKK